MSAYSIKFQGLIRPKLNLPLSMSNSHHINSIQYMIPRLLAYQCKRITFLYLDYSDKIPSQWHFKFTTYFIFIWSWINTRSLSNIQRKSEFLKTNFTKMSQLLTGKKRIVQYSLNECQLNTIFLIKRQTK